MVGSADLLDLCVASLVTDPGFDLVFRIPELSSSSSMIVSGTFVERRDTWCELCKLDDFWLWISVTPELSEASGTFALTAFILACGGRPFLVLEEASMSSASGGSAVWI